MTNLDIKELATALNCEDTLMLKELGFRVGLDGIHDAQKTLVANGYVNATITLYDVNDFRLSHKNVCKKWVRHEEYIVSVIEDIQIILKNWMLPERKCTDREVISKIIEIVDDENFLSIIDAYKLNTGSTNSFGSGFSDCGGLLSTEY